MAKALWEKPITKNDDWGGGKFSGGAPVSGKVVQDFIKESLNKKFGYLYYNKSAKKYYVFADEDDFEAWWDNKAENANLVLATFDAPAPATIRITSKSSSSIIQRFGTDIPPIIFHYYVEDTSGNPVAEDVIMSVNITSSGSLVSSSVETLPIVVKELSATPDYFYNLSNDEFPDRNLYNLSYTEGDSTKIGAYYKYTGLSKLIKNAGKYTIVLTFTGATTQVSTTLAFEYELIDLQISAEFDYCNGINKTERYFSPLVTVSGAENRNKYINILVDGQPLMQDSLGFPSETVVYQDNSLFGNGIEESHFINIYLKDNNLVPVKWETSNAEIFSNGKHSLQLSSYINLENGEKLKTKTLYYDFVITSENDRQSFLLYQAELESPRDEESQYFMLQAKQYTQINYNIGLFNGTGSTTNVLYEYDELTDQEEGGTSGPHKDNNLARFTHILSSGNIDNNIYTVRSDKDIMITITNQSNIDDKIEIIVEVSENETISIAQTTDSLVLYYNAENKTNDSADYSIWIPQTFDENIDVNKFIGEINQKVGFIKDNDGNVIDGWNGEALILKNLGAIQFPVNLFKINQYINSLGKNITKTGFTFEIDFETMNVQDDNAPIMIFNNFTAESNSSNSIESYIKIYSTYAEIRTNNGTTAKTNFKDGERIKLAFIVNQLEKDNALNDLDYFPGTIFIMVNGVLDRVVKYGAGDENTDSFDWTMNNNDNPNNTSFTVGNTDGKANIKLYSIRIYNKPLTIDEEFNNYLYGLSGEKLEKTFDKNNILENNTISLDKVKAFVPTMVIATDYDAYKPFGTDQKKKNTYAEVLFTDPKNPSLGFYARNCYLSPQGTSSMSYPIKNLRLYFCKTFDKNTFYFNEGVNFSDSNIIIPEYETEFWPISEFNDLDDMSFNSVRNYLKDAIPFSTNKKADGTSETSIKVGGNYLKAIHEGYHKIGSNRTVAEKARLTYQYLHTLDYDPAAIASNDKDAVNSNTGELTKTSPVKIYRITENTSAKQIKDAFGETHNVFSATGFSGYDMSQDNPTYTKHKIDLFEDITDTIKDYTVDQLITILNNDDLYISAYRPAIHTGENLDSDSYKKYLKELRWSGVKLYKYNADAPTHFEVHKKALNYKTLYYTLGSNWRQYDYTAEEAFNYGPNFKIKHISGWTDRWTLKTDYAESSMTHNAGIARLWGNAMYNVTLDEGYICRTNAQKFVQNNIDIRTSCDGKPIVLFYKQITGIDSDGYPIYANEKFAGLHNIMTDKSSTKLFGFEDITSPEFIEKTDDSEFTSNSNSLKTWFDASKVECWECLDNGSNLIKAINTAYDKKDDNEQEASGNESKDQIGSSRLIWKTYEPRWPDSGQERHEYDPAKNPLGNNWPDDTYGVGTTNLENFLRWVNFCKDAIKYTIGSGNNTVNGYSNEVFLQFETGDKATEYYNKYIAAVNILDNPSSSEDARMQAEEDKKQYMFYTRVEQTGNVKYYQIGDEYTNATGSTSIVSFGDDFTPGINYADWYYRNSNIDMEVVSKEENTNRINEHVWLVKIPSFDYKWRCILNGEIDEGEASQYRVDTYVFKTGNNEYQYYDNFGDLVKTNKATLVKYDDTFTGEEDDEHKVVLSSGENPTPLYNLTYMQYFKATKKDHLDLYKVAAYYVYLIRFGAVDQVVKNSMMTTEDGQHWYFINYDNDTILGVRNDGILKYNWDIDRNSYDSSISSYSFAGATSVLWNNLELDDEFMSIVQQIDKAMNSQGLLSSDAVLAWLNEYQEGAWCERLYNEQEKVKYLIPAKQDSTKAVFLGFMQGNRHSHRSWWISNRWDLYNAKWGSGNYEKNSIVFYYTNSSASAPSIGNPKNLFALTAASRYFFNLIKDGRQEEDNWFREVKADESTLYSTQVAGSIGTVINIKGPQKIKVLNLRPENEFINNIRLVNPGGDWNQNSLLTKLLIGSNANDTKIGSTSTSIESLNEITSLEELDIRGMRDLANGQLSINNLSNLHRFRAKNTNITSFTPKSGASFYEISLPRYISSLNLDTIQFVKDPNEYKSYQTQLISSNPMDNGTNDTVEYITEHPNHITKFGSTYGDILPIYASSVEQENGVTKIPSAFKYCKKYQVDEHGIPSLVPAFREVDGTWEYDYVFDYTPSNNLMSVVFNNVTGIDTYQFLLDWKDNIQSNPVSSERNVTLKGIQWVIEGDDNMSATQKLIYIYHQYNYLSFAGTIYLKNPDNRGLSEEEFNSLVEIFGEDAFIDSSHKLLINSGETMYTHVSGNTEDVDTVNNGKKYQLIQGNTLTINSTVFPLDTDKYVYTLRYNNSNDINLFGSIQYRGSKGNEEYYVDIQDKTMIKLTNIDGHAELWISPENQQFNTQITQLGRLLEIHVVKYDEALNAPSNKVSDDMSYRNGQIVYVQSILQYLPAETDFIVYDGDIDNSKIVTNTYNISDNDTHTFIIKNTNDISNVDVKSISISFIEETNDIHTYINSYTNNVASEILGDISIDNTNKEYRFNIKNNLSEFAQLNKTVNLYLSISLNDEKTIYNIPVQYSINCIIANTVRLSLDESSNLDEFSEINNNDTILINNVGDYIYQINLVDNQSNTTNLDYNIAIRDSYSSTTSGIGIELVKDNDLNKYSLKISVHPTKSVYIAGDNAFVQLECSIPGTEISFTYTFDLDIKVIYPDYVSMSCHDPYLYNNLGEEVTRYFKDSFNRVSNNEAFNIVITNGSSIDSLELDIKAMGIAGNANAESNMPYQVIITSISEEQTTHNWVNTDTALSFDSGNVLFEQQLSEVSLNGSSVNSANKLLLTVNSKEINSNVETQYTIHCQINYDSDRALNNNSIESAHRFENNSNTDKSDISFQFKIIRSTCSSLSWKANKLIDSEPDNGYTYYLVDEDNQYYEYTVKLNENASDLHDPQSYTISSPTVSFNHNWKGIGFVFKDNTIDSGGNNVLSGPNQNIFPIFIGLKAFYDAKLSAHPDPASIYQNSSLINMDIIQNENYRNMYNGEFLTDSICEYFNDRYNIFKRIVSKYPYYYIPSMKELHQVITGRDSNPSYGSYYRNIPSESICALNALIKDLTGIISIHAYSFDNSYGTEDSNISEKWQDWFPLGNYFNFEDLLASYGGHENIYYMSSLPSMNNDNFTINTVNIYETGLTDPGALVDGEHVYQYKIQDSEIGSWYNQRIAIIPFVRVQ